MHAEVVNELQIYMTKATTEKNTAKIHGGLFSFESTGKYTLILDLCQINDNSASTGSGGLVYSSGSTSDTKVYFKRSNVISNSAKSDGGLVYLGGASVNWLTIDSTKMENQMSNSENGGLASLRGKEAKIVIQSLADPIKPTQIIDSKTT